MIARPTGKAPISTCVVEWSEPGPGVRVLDIATGGGHVARRLREEGCTVVTLDPAPGMEPDVVAPAESLPFEDASFDVVTCRIAAHHFTDVRLAVAEMARVTRRLVVVEDNVFVDERVEEAERLRDPTHVRCYSEDEWKELLAAAGLEVLQLRPFERRPNLEDWLSRVDTPSDDAKVIRDLLRDHVEDGGLRLSSIVVQAGRAG